MYIQYFSEARVWDYGTKRRLKRETYLLKHEINTHTYTCLRPELIK